MKKLVLFFLFCFSFPLVYAQDLIYVNSDIYLKSDLDSSDGTAITTNNASDATYSPDGQYIVYTNTSDQSWCYRKNANDTGEGTAITSTVCNDPSYSPDGLSIIYTASNNYCYVKDASDNSNGTQISPNSACNTATYSPDGQYIFFMNGGSGYQSRMDNDGTDIVNVAQSGYYAKYTPDGLYVVYMATANGLCYKKVANDISDGTAITSNGCRSPSFSSDGSEMIYVNTSDGNKIYKKNINDTSNGFAITSAGSPQYSTEYEPSVLQCNPDIDPECYCSNVAVLTDNYSYQPFDFSSGFIFSVEAGAERMRVLPDDYNFFTNPYSPLQIDSTVDGNWSFTGGWYPSDLFATGSGVFDTTSGVFGQYEDEIHVNTYRNGTAASYSYYGTGGITANTGSLAFNYLKIHSPYDWAEYDVKYWGIELDVNGNEYFSENTLYDQPFGGITRFPKATRRITIYLPHDLNILVENIELGAWLQTIDTVEQCVHIDDSEISGIPILGGDGVGTSLALNNTIVEQKFQNNLDSFKFDNPILQFFLEKLQKVLNSLGFNNLLELLKITVPNDPVATIVLPKMTISSDFKVGVVTQSVDLWILPDTHELGSEMETSVYQPYLIAILCTLVWLGFFGLMIGFVFFGNTLFIGLVEKVFNGFFGSEVFRNNGGNVFSLFTMVSWLFIISKFVILVLVFVNFLAPLMVIVKDTLLGFLTIVMVNFGGYATFVTLANGIVYSVIVGVLVYALMKASKASLSI